MVEMGFIEETGVKPRMREIVVSFPFIEGTNAYKQLTYGSLNVGQTNGSRP